RNANPTNTPTSTTQRIEPCSIARTVAYAASVSRRTSSASGLLNRNISAATASSACGTRMLHELTPKMRAEISIGQRNAGDLSTVMKFAASDEPKKNAFQLFVPACTAAE